MHVPLAAWLLVTGYMQRNMATQAFLSYLLTTLMIIGSGDECLLLLHMDYDIIMVKMVNLCPCPILFPLPPSLLLSVSLRSLSRADHLAYPA